MAKMGKQVGKYEIISPLGSGATAEVYHARDTVLGREVALKVLRPALVADSSAFERFVKEAQAASGLFHPNIATVLDMGEADGRYFIAMRLIPGLSLDKRLKEKGPLSWEETLRMAQQVGNALDYAHEQGFLHRDVKPSNIICTPRGDYVLTDFGLQKAMLNTGFTSHTGAVLGTPAYIAPEIWEGKEASPATDQYSLACVTYEGLTGKTLFAGHTPPAVMKKHFEAIQFPGSWPENVPAGVEIALQKALAKNPNERYQTCEQFRSALASKEIVEGTLLLDGKYRVEAILSRRESFLKICRASYMDESQSRQTCLLKVLYPDLPGLSESEYTRLAGQLRLEARLGRAIVHPHILQAVDFVEKGNDLYLALEYADGDSLEELLIKAEAGGTLLPVDEGIQIGIEVATGLGALHEANVVHRDLKPANILFHKGQIKIAGLGFAQTLEEYESRKKSTNPSAHPGTPKYQSPEQKANGAGLSPSSDVYALGLVFFQLLTGQTYKPGLDARGIRPEIPHWVNKLLGAMLMEKVVSRPQNGTEVAQLLQKGRLEENSRQTLQREINAAIVIQDRKKAKRLIARLKKLGQDGQEMGVLLENRLPPPSPSPPSPSRPETPRGRVRWPIYAGLAVMILGLGLLGGRWLIGILFNGLAFTPFTNQVTQVPPTLVPSALVLSPTPGFTFTATSSEVSPAQPSLTPSPTPSNTPVPTVIPTLPGIWAVTTNLGYLHKGPDVNHPFVYQNWPAMPHDPVNVEILGRYFSWYRVKAPDGQVGWLASDWLDLDSIDLSRIPVVTDVPTPPAIPSLTPTPTEQPGPPGPTGTVVVPP